MSEKVLIIGSGISGLLAAKKIKNSGHADVITICERNSEITRPPTAAAFYCHEFITEKITPLSFEVQWVIEGDKENASKLYAQKVYGSDFTGEVSITEKEAKGWAIDTEYLIDCTREMIQPNMSLTSVDLVARLATFNDYECVRYDTLISTIPMPLFLEILNKPTLISGFHSKPIYVECSVSPVNSVNTMWLTYYTDPKSEYYRSTEWGGNIFWESMKPLPNTKPMYPGKIWANEKATEIREEFKQHGVYFQGRYARWVRKYFVSDVWNNVLEEIYG